MSLTPDQLAAMRVRLTAAEMRPLPDAVRDVLADMRRLLRELKTAERDRAVAESESKMRSHVAQAFAKDNQRLIGQNLELCNAIEFHQRERKASA